VPVIFWPLGRGAGGTTPGDCPVLDVPTLAVADAADGTGGTATVTGSTAGTTNTLWAWPYPTSTGSLTRTTVGSRTGDGTIDIVVPDDLALGAWLWMIESRQDESVEVSNLVAQPLTDAAAESSLYERIVNAAAAVIAALGLAESPTVRAQRLPERFAGEDLPVIFVCFEDEEIEDGTTEVEQLTRYPVLIVFVRASNKLLATDKGVMPRWREQVRRALHKTRDLAGVDEIRDSEVELQPVFDRPAWESGYDLSAIRVNYLAAEARAE
jgi:hypothetical protein